MASWSWRTSQCSCAAAVTFIGYVNEGSEGCGEIPRISVMELDDGSPCGEEVFVDRKEGDGAPTL